MKLKLVFTTFVVLSAALLTYISIVSTPRYGLEPSGQGLIIEGWGYPLLTVINHDTDGRRDGLDWTIDSIRHDELWFDFLFF